MLQEISPYKLDNSFKFETPNNDDYILIFENNYVFLKNENNELTIPNYKFIKSVSHISDSELTYLFKIDNLKFFLLSSESKFDKSALSKENINIFRTLQPSWMSFGGITGKHLSDWYSSNKYCGKCGKPLKHHDVERALQCEECGLIIYPTISPAIIVGIINKDKILLTKYSRGSYKKYGLVAGYTEIGETLEETVQREVMEEVGLKVKNIRYYKNQPWAFSNSLLVGFFADLDGSDEVSLDKNELAIAEWFRYDEMPPIESNISLTSNMMQEFININTK